MYFRPIEFVLNVLEAKAGQNGPGSSSIVSLKQQLTPRTSVMGEMRHTLLCPSLTPALVDSDVICAHRMTPRILFLEAFRNSSDSLTELKSYTPETMHRKPSRNKAFDDSLVSSQEEGLGGRTLSLAVLWLGGASSSFDLIMSARVPKDGREG